MKIAIVLILVLVLAAGGLFLYMRFATAETPANFRLDKVQRGDLLSTISATGTLEPEEVVNVGAQVMGRINDFGIDLEAEKKRPLPKEPKGVAQDAANVLHGSEKPQEAPGSQKTQAPPGSQKAQAPLGSPRRADGEKTLVDASAVSVEKDAGPAATALSARPVDGSKKPTAGLPSAATGTPAAGLPPAADPKSQTSSSKSPGAFKKPSDKRPRIDYGSIVHDGTELAYIDDMLYRATRDQAKASYERACADLQQATVKREQAKEELVRADQLVNHPITSGGQRTISAISKSDYTSVKANYDVAVANVAIAQAAMNQAKAAWDQTEINLAYTVIKSPVEGVIVARRVNTGQTVVASLNAPSLFLIAKDLKQMQVWASVNEADIGRIRPGMDVKFTVDAYPGETFTGHVLQTRLNAQMNQNVVTYTVVVRTENPDGKLLPYLTANLQFQVERHHGVLKVANAALRWKPRTQQIHPDFRQKVAKEKGGKGKDRGGKSEGPAKTDDAAKSPGDPAKSAGGKGPKEERGRIWVQDGNYVKPVDVKIGDTDGSFTMITGPDLQQDMEVVVGEEVADQGAGDAENPFAPKIFKGKKM